MQCIGAWVLLFAICSPVLVHTKSVYIMVPGQVRRNPQWTASAGPPPSNLKRSPQLGNVVYGKHVSVYYPRTPHGGGHPEQSQESANHVSIPYGKSGRGFLPYDSIKGGGGGPPFLDHKKFLNGVHQQKLHHLQHAPSFAQSISSPSYHSPQSHGYFNDKLAGAPIGLQLHDHINSEDLRKKLAFRPSPPDIGKDSQVLKPLYHRAAGSNFNNQISHEAPNIITHQPTINFIPVTHNVQTPVSHGTISGGHNGIVLRDSLLVDDYNKKLQDFAKDWPKTNAFSGAHGVVSGFAGTNSPLITASPQFTGFTDGKLFPVIGRQGYAVKEDIVEPQHDFRSQPIQTLPFQTIPASAPVVTHPQAITGFGSAHIG